MRIPQALEVGTVKYMQDMVVHETLSFERLYLGRSFFLSFVLPGVWFLFCTYLPFWSSELECTILLTS